jgi:proteasome lid subunit RPN8/RPN11
VNAGSEVNNFMIEWTEDLEKVGRKEFNVGWYHSHPGFGCWLSGIDVTT